MVLFERFDLGPKLFCLSFPRRLTPRILERSGKRKLKVLGFEEERGRKELARKPTCTSSALGSAVASEHGERGGRYLDGDTIA